MLEKLTDEQRKMIPVVKDEWISFMHDSSFNKEQCIKGITWLYELCGYKKPKIIIADSPKACKMIAKKLGDENPEFSYYGNLSDYHWLSFYEYFKKIGVKFNTEKFDKFLALIKSGVYDMIQYETHCIVSKKPDIIKTNQTGLHSIEGPAIHFRDGFELYYLDGVKFEKKLWKKIATRKIKAKELLKIDNIEQRYIGMKYIGASILFKEFDTKLIETSAKGNSLYSMDGVIPNRTLKILNYKCTTTGREYWKFVPDKMMNADEAQAWSHNMTLEQYLNITKEA